MNRLRFIFGLVVILMALSLVRCVPRPVSPQHATLHIATDSTNRTGNMVVAKAWVADAEECIDRWVIQWGDKISRDSEKTSSCENGSCCGRDSFLALNRYPVPGQYIITVTVSFWGKELGRTSMPVTAGFPETQ